MHSGHTARRWQLKGPILPVNWGSSAAKSDCWVDSARSKSKIARTNPLSALISTKISDHPVISLTLKPVNLVFAPNSAALLCRLETGVEPNYRRHVRLFFAAG
jgi:hypothetical protein